PIERQRHRLIEQRLAVAGRQHGQRIAPVEERAKRTLLLRPQPRDAELLSGDRARPRERIGAALAPAAPPSLPRTACSLPRAFVRGHRRIPAEVDVTTASSTGGASSSNTLRLSRALGLLEAEHVLSLGTFHTLLVVLLPEVRPRPAVHVGDLVLDDLARRNRRRAPFDRVDGRHALDEHVRRTDAHVRDLVEGPPDAD